MALLTNFSINASTADPALTSNITLLGFFNWATMFSREVAPMTFVPLASFFINSSTFETVLLNATTCKISKRKKNKQITDIGQKNLCVFLGLLPDSPFFFFGCHLGTYHKMFKTKFSIFFLLIFSVKEYFNIINCNVYLPYSLNDVKE